MTAPTLIFLDTNVFSVDSSLSSAAWDSLQNAAQSGLIELAISEVTVQELNRQVHEKAQSLFEKVSSEHEALKQHGIVTTPTVLVDTDTFDSEFRERLKRRLVRVQPLPAVPHTEVLARDIAVRQPFNRGGKGYRDTLIWHSFLDWQAAHTASPTRAIFVTDNIKDFGGDGKLHLAEALNAELPCGVAVRLERKLTDAVAEVRKLKLPVAEVTESAPVDPDDAAHEGIPRPMHVAQQAGLRAFESLTGQDWESIETFPFGLHPVETATVTWVEVDEGSVEAQLVDTVSQTQIWDVRAAAELSIEGMVYRGDAAFLDSAWDVSVGSFEERYVEATRVIQCTLVADVRVKADMQTTDAALTEVIPDPPGRRR